MSDLKENIKESYKKTNLSEDQFNRINQLQEKRKYYFLNWNYFAVASIICIITFLISPKQSTLELIAHEVIYNHKKNLPSEFLVDKVTELNSRLVKLDFKVQASTKLANYTVVGGRYCSIQGNTAAQIKMKLNNKYSTIYQSGFTNVDSKNLPFTFIKDDIEVLIWIEGDVLFAKAKNL